MDRAISKKKSKTLTKEKEVIEKQRKENCYFFLNPSVCLRIYRDFLIPDFSYTCSSPTYFFQNYLFYKSIYNLHIRDKGVVVQFQDIDPNYITPIEILKSRLDSMGNVHAHQLAIFLELYYAYFEESYKKAGENSENKIVCQKNWNSIYDCLLKYVDGLFEKFDEDLVIITVYQMHKSIDDRLLMIGYNKELVKWLILDEKDDLKEIGNLDIIEQLLQIYSYFTYENYIEELNEFMIKFSLKPKVDLSEDFLVRNINVTFGQVQGLFRLKSFNLDIQEEKFNIFCTVFKKEDQNPLFKKLIANKNVFSDKKDNEKKPSLGKDWAELLKLYYPNVMK